MIQRLLDGAAAVIAHAPHCWLSTRSERGVDARPMGRATTAASQSDWRLCFIADARSNKVRDIRSSPQVCLIFESGDEGFVSVAGGAKVSTDAAIIRRRWVPSYDRIFPTPAGRANAVFIDIEAEELRLWNRGLTPEPFGVRSSTLRRNGGGDWRLDSELY